MMSFFKKLGKTKGTLLIIGVLIVAWAIYYFGFRNTSGQYQFVAVKRGTITEEVSITGSTTPVKSLSLAFENGGTIAAVNFDVGMHVNPGDAIARLDTRDLQAQLAQAQANVDSENAKLRSLQAGAQPADIQASQAALAKGEQDLTNLYGSIGDTLADGYAKANDAVRGQIALFFSSSESNNPQLSFSVSNSQTLNNAQMYRLQASTELNAWQKELAIINSSSPISASPTSTLDAVLQDAISHLTVIKALFSATAESIIEATSLSATTVNTYKTDISTGLNEVNAANTNLNSMAQNIASQKITVQQLQAQLNLKLAGSTPEDIQAQQAQVEQAQANTQSVEVKIAKASLVSPIVGVITLQNAKVGQIAAPGAALVSIISSGDLEIDANVPEVDIGKVNLGNPVDMTFDAFQNETFTGKVFYIDPAETIVQGVVNYKIKISFDKTDPRIKSGLTANLNIKSNQKDNTFILPQFAILQTDTGNFVETVANGQIKQNPVTLGIHDQQGNVEVLSGVTEGEQVVNIGLK